MPQLDGARVASRQGVAQDAPKRREPRAGAGKHQRLSRLVGFDRKTNTCPIDPVCGLKGALLNAQAAFFAELERYTLADFAPRAPALIKLWRRQAAEPGGR